MTLKVTLKICAVTLVREDGDAEGDAEHDALDDKRQVQVGLHFIDISSQNSSFHHNQLVIPAEFFARYLENNHGSTYF